MLAVRKLQNKLLTMKAMTLSNCMTLQGLLNRRMRHDHEDKGSACKISCK